MQRSRSATIVLLSLLSWSSFPLGKTAATAPTATLHVVAPESAQARTEFTAEIRLDTGGQMTSAVRIGVSTPDNLAFIKSDATGSIFDQELTAPSPSENRFRFARMRFDRGWNGTDGLLLQVTFRALSEGQATITIEATSSEVIAFADSSNILQRVVPASLSIERPPTMGGGGSGGEGAGGGVRPPPPPPTSEPVVVRRMRLRPQPTPVPAQLSCAMLPEEEPLQQKRGNLLMVIGGKNILFRDVPTDAWFTPFIAALLQWCIASGYADRRGNPTGIFGSVDPVTYAELAKMTFKAAGREVVDTRSPQNPSARDHWGAAFIAAAEQASFKAYAAFPDADDPATRAAVVQTILEALQIPLREDAIPPYRDVTLHHASAPAIATATALGIVEGFRDDAGNLLFLFGADAPVKRAEVAKIIIEALRIACGR